MTATAPAARTALITGASSGIGKALAEEFAADGYALVLAARSVDKMQALAADLKQRHSTHVTVIGADLETTEGAARLYSDIKAQSITVNALVNNAGYGGFGEFKDSVLEAELAMMRLNMDTVVVLTKLCLPDLLATKGKILNTASTAAFQPGPYMAVYYATKAFVLSFSEAIAAELEGTGVTVTALCPGPTQSGFQDKAVMNDSALVKGKKLPTSEAVAKAGYQAMLKGKRVFIPGAMNWIMAQTPRFTPRNMVTAVVKKISKPV
jgi:short-subunit dehydrogenase